MNNNLYTQITEKLVPLLPSDWEKVHLYSQITEDAYEFFFYVYNRTKL